jgi:ribosomal protein L16 Arg81 hydroxylase
MLSPSAVSLENPDLSLHARAKHMKEYSEKLILNPGDALFIPEGWYAIYYFVQLYTL